MAMYIYIYIYIHTTQTSTSTQGKGLKRKPLPRADNKHDLKLARLENKQATTHICYVCCLGVPICLLKTNADTDKQATTHVGSVCRLV